jgi:hypothetical protein
LNLWLVPVLLMTGCNDGKSSNANAVVLNEQFLGNYIIGPDGRSIITLQSSFGKQTFAAYFFGPNQGMLMQTSGSDFFIGESLGEFRQQVGEPFTAASISGSFLTNTKGMVAGKYISGATAFSGAGGVESYLDVTAGWIPSHLDSSGTYSVTPSGRGTIAYESPEKQTVVFWAVSPTELVGISTVNEDDYEPALTEYIR